MVLVLAIIKINKLLLSLQNIATNNYVENEVGGKATQLQNLKLLNRWCDNYEIEVWALSA